MHNAVISAFLLAATLSAASSEPQAGQLPPDVLSRCKLPALIAQMCKKEDNYYYNTVTGMCDLQAIGGCDGFVDELSCVIDCVCRLNPSEGECDGNATRYFHNRFTNKCEPFRYGGCGGNGNNFVQIAACENTCVPRGFNDIDIARIMATQLAKAHQANEARFTGHNVDLDDDVGDRAAPPRRPSVSISPN